MFSSIYLIPSISSIYGLLISDAEMGLNVCFVFCRNERFPVEEDVDKNLQRYTCKSITYKINKLSFFFSLFIYAYARLPHGHNPMLCSLRIAYESNQSVLVLYTHIHIGAH